MYYVALTKFKQYLGTSFGKSKVIKENGRLLRKGHMFSCAENPSKTGTSASRNSQNIRFFFFFLFLLIKPQPALHIHINNY